MLGLVDRDQIKHSPGTRTRLRFQIGHTALSGADCQIEAEPVVFEQCWMRFYWGMPRRLSKMPRFMLLP
jgi:hypothetical protein